MLFDRLFEAECDKWASDPIRYFHFSEIRTSITLGGGVDCVQFIIRYSEKYRLVLPAINTVLRVRLAFE